MADFPYQPMFPHAHPVETPWRKLDIEGVTVSEFKGRRVLEIAPHVLSELAAEAMRAATSPSGRGGELLCVRTCITSVVPIPTTSGLACATLNI